jgi:hypothetical protein
MSDMLDLTEKYFDQKFQNTNDRILSVDDKLDKVVTSVEKIDGKVVEHDVRLSAVEKSQIDHLEEHKNKETKKEFSVSQWIAVALVIAAVLFDKVL